MTSETGSGPARVLAIVHHVDAGPGVFGDAIRRAGAELDEWLIVDGALPPRDPLDYTAVVFLGSSVHADQAEAHPWLERERELLGELVQERVPVLGVCLGAQLLAQATGGKALRSAEPEIGWYEVALESEGADDPVLGFLAPRFEALGWHSYEVELPDEATLLARSDACIQAFRVGDRAWGIQFHSEVTWRDLLVWIEGSRSDPDAGGVDLDALRHRSEQSIGAWNELGRAMAARFIAQATLPRSDGAKASGWGQLDFRR
ncbi:MAG: type 1 glutamine amidotransferase [Actinomycetota bacterium]|nr:type 1 glutamine amidotransferase [Actinomycetota bacterium]